MLLIRESAALGAALEQVGDAVAQLEEAKAHAERAYRRRRLEILSQLDGRLPTRMSRKSLEDLAERVAENVGDGPELRQLRETAEVSGRALAELLPLKSLLDQHAREQQARSRHAKSISRWFRRRYGDVREADAAEATP